MPTLTAVGLIAGVVLARVLVSDADQDSFEPYVYFGLIGAAVGAGLAIAIRLLRIGHKALTKIERRLDDK